METIDEIKETMPHEIRKLIFDCLWILRPNICVSGSTICAKYGLAHICYLKPDLYKCWTGERTSDKARKHRKNQFKLWRIARHLNRTVLPELSFIRLDYMRFVFDTSQPNGIEKLEEMISYTDLPMRQSLKQYNNHVLIYVMEPYEHFIIFKRHVWDQIMEDACSID